MLLTPEKVFGVDLSVVMARPRQRVVPTIVGDMIMYIYEKGLKRENIFLKSFPRKYLAQFKALIENNDVNVKQLDVYLIASLLRMYLQELPGSLFTHQLYQKLVRNCENLQVISATVCLELTVCNRNLMEFLFLLFGLIVQNSSKNKMTLRRLALVFAPILLTPEQETTETLEEMENRLKFFVTLVKNLDKVFSNPFGNTIMVHSRVPCLFDQRARITKSKGLFSRALEDIWKSLGSKLEELGRLGDEADLNATRKCLEKMTDEKFNFHKQFYIPDVYYYSCKTSLESGHASLIGLRKKMEDRVCIYDDFDNSFNLAGNGKNKALYAIFDGHAGDEVSEMASSIVPRMIAYDLNFNKNNVITALRNALIRADELVVEKALVKNWKCGSTAVILMIVDEMLYVANLGDSEAILALEDEDDAHLKHVILTRKHSPADDEEKERILLLGGTVLKGRVFGRLAISRGLGDVEYKKPFTNANYLSNEPSTGIYKLTERVKFILLSCDGLWEKTSYKEAIDFIQKKIDSKENIQSICEQLANLGLSNGSKDNVTVIIIKLNWKRKDTNENWIYYKQALISLPIAS